jgi:hypothetical protein
LENYYYYVITMLCSKQPIDFRKSFSAAPFIDMLCDKCKKE